MHEAKPRKGRYSTRARDAIARLLRDEQRHLSATQIHRLLKLRGADVSLATVYRTVELLVQEGAASARTDEGGALSYNYCTPQHHHHHAICSRCGRVEEIDCFPMTEFANNLMQRYGFALESHAMEFSGLCARCR